MKMKPFYFLLITALTIQLPVRAQDEYNRTRFSVAGSAPELINAGLSIDLGKSSQIGFYVGLLPTMGLNGAKVTIGLSAEYRL